MFIGYSPRPQPRKFGQRLVHNHEKRNIDPKEAAIQALIKSKFKKIDKENESLGSTASYYNSLRGGKRDIFRKKGSKDQFENSSNVPQWLRYRNKVLRFSCYFEEAVNGAVSVRKCKLHYFLEDNGIQIVEPPTFNCGYQQGVFLERDRAWKHQILPKDLYLGAKIDIHERTFHITDCDVFTREFFRENNLFLGDKPEMPTSTYKPYFGTKELIRVRKHLEKYDGKRVVIGQKVDSIRFRHYNGKVLRFFCQWEGREEHANGTPRVFTLLYFLTDYTIKICSDAYDRKKEKDHYHVLLKRCSLPKNPLAAITNTGRFGPPGDAKYYTDKDLKVGETINVFGRKFKLTGCDKFTQDYYLYNYDFKQSHVSLQSKKRLQPPLPASQKIEEGVRVLPYDTRKDHDRFMRLNGVELRWRAKFSKEMKDEYDRQFCICFYPEDDTIKIFEFPNSGFRARTFLSRMRVVNGETEQCFEVTDLAKGKIVVINGYGFEITDEEQHASNYKRELEERRKLAAEKKEEIRRKEAELEKSRLEKMRKIEDQKLDAALVEYIAIIDEILKLQLGPLKWRRVIDLGREDSISMVEFKEFLNRQMIRVNIKLLKHLWACFGANEDEKISVDKLKEIILGADKLKIMIRQFRTSRMVDIVRNL
mmetsp:Transcript_15620/g.23556  ORF Transcript_15620/g.23556 Transcript_15620/m.23556 type:complete len:648 (-) Transcript_15620:59-2002(-)